MASRAERIAADAAMIAWLASDECPVAELRERAKGYMDAMAYAAYCVRGPGLPVLKSKGVAK